MKREPDEEVAAAIATQLFGRTPERVRRFGMGLGHWVYDVHVGDLNVVVRVGATSQRDDLAGTLLWSKSLRALGVPLPELLASGEWQKLPYVVLERFAGDDLGLVYETLARAQKQAIAAKVCGIQRLVASLGDGRGYGDIRLPGAPCLSSWGEVIDASIARSRSRMVLTEHLDHLAVEQLEQRIARFRPYFARIRPTPFLDDTTTKNVIVHRGVFTGIVDVDWICYGDPLWTIGLTRTSLLSSSRDVDYTDYWAELLDVTDEQRAAIELYTAVFALDFMSEIGNRFNRESAPLDEELFERLQRLLREQLRS